MSNISHSGAKNRLCAWQLEGTAATTRDLATAASAKPDAQYDA